MSEEVIERTPNVPSCAYCHCTDPNSLLQCRACKKWFCNGVIPSHGSHVCIHLILSKHTSLKTHPDSKYKGKVIRCSRCKSDTLFDLRSSTRNPTDLNNLVCVSSCLAKDIAKQKKGDTRQWYSLTDERQLVGSLFPTCCEPGPGSIDLSYRLVSMYEHLLVGKPNLKIEEVELKDPMKMDPVPLEFENSVAYYSIFEPLLKLEDYQQRQSRETDGDKHKFVSFFVKDDCVMCEFLINQNNYSHPLRQFDHLTLTLSINQEIDEEDAPLPKKKYRKYGTELDLEDLRGIENDQNQLEDSIDIAGEMAQGRRVEYGGSIEELEPEDKGMGLYRIAFRLFTASLPSKEKRYRDGFYDIRLNDMGSILNRRLRAMHDMDDESSMHQDIWETIMGVRPKFNQECFYIHMRDITDLDVPNLKPLNDSQNSAIVHALRSRFSIIQGPPGTGKTNTAAALVYHLVQRNKKQLYDVPIENKDAYGKPKMCRKLKLKLPGRVLVCAPSNVAADEICQRIHQTGVNVVRVMALSKQDQPSPVKDLCVHVLARKKLEEEDSVRAQEIMGIRARRMEGERISNEQWAEYLKVITAVEHEIVSQASVVVSTCDTSGNSLLRFFVFNSVLIDEASQTVEPETMVPIVHGAQRVILVGDQCQLEPVVLNSRCRQLKYSQTLMDRLIELGFVPNMLTLQYRMHPTLAEFSSEHYYNNRLLNGITANQRPVLTILPYPNPSCPFFFWHVEGQESIGSKGTSFINMEEAKQTLELVRLLVAKKVKADRIGVITSYAGQKILLVNLFTRANLSEVEIATVNTYQGREKDYIIYTCVRSNSSNTVGFLDNPRRLNVSITRARFGLFVIGNAKMLMNSKLFSEYLRYHNSYGTVVSGPLEMLTPYII